MAKVIQQVAVQEDLAYSEVLTTANEPHEKTAVFAGARPQALPCLWDKTHKFFNRMQGYCNGYVEYLIARGFTRFIVGGNLGSEMAFANAVIAAKHTFPKVTLAVILPYAGYEKLWMEPSKAQFHSLLEQADETIYAEKAMPTPKGLDAAKHSVACLINRNAIAAKEADLVILFGNDKPVDAMKAASSGKRTVAVSFNDGGSFTAAEVK